MTNENHSLLKIKDLSIEYGHGENKVHALRNINLNILGSECLGIAGESGCGKSTLAMSIMKLLPKNANYSQGHCYFENTDLMSCNEKQMRSIRMKRIAMIFQNPMSCLNPFKRIGKQLEEGFFHQPNLSSSDIKNEVMDLLAQVKFDEPKRVYKSYPHELSGGMCQRVMIAMAISQKPELLIADEPTTALDVTTQKIVLDLLNELRLKYKMSMLFITHDLSVLSKMCDRIVVMYAGEVVEVANKNEFFKNTKHPYSKNLIEACPTLKGPKEEVLKAIPGLPPNLKAVPKLCSFLPRCDKKITECENNEVNMIGSKGHYSRCHLSEDKF
jgi:oligopeptide/dipeptide ABC transporter ATP-binding protein